MLDDIEKRALDLIDPGEVAADLVTLVGFPSTGGTAAEHSVQAWCASRLSDLEMSVDHWSIDVEETAARPDFPGMEVERCEAWGCVATSPARDAHSLPALILNGHVDVVPPGDTEQWTASPWELRTHDERWWGRGACDMKGGVAAILGATSAVQRLGLPLRRPFAVHTVVGEEDGGIGTYATLTRGHRGDSCIIAEPTAHDIVAANAGSLTFTIEITGHATHGSTRLSGVSAIDKFVVVQRGLRELERIRNAETHPLFTPGDLCWPISVGKIHAGDWASDVPDRLVAEGRYGVMPGETLLEAKTLFRAALAEICEVDPWLREHPVSLSWNGGHFSPGQFPADHPMLTELSRAIADSSIPAANVIGAPYGSDLRLYAAAGIATLQYGPGDIRDAHAADESVKIASVMEAARAYTLMILRSCR